MTGNAPRRPSRWLLALLVGVPSLAAVYWLSTRSEEPGTRFDAALDEALAPVLAQHEAALRLGSSTPTQARLLAREAALHSVQFLAPADLELWAATRSRVARASPVACAKLWQGGDTSFWGEAVAALGDEALAEHVEMLARGLSLRLERKPPPEPRPDAIERGMRAIAEQLPPSERAAFDVDVTRRDLPEARACQLFLQVSSGAERLPTAARIEFLRGLAKALPASEF
jgi:hypothetical protein